MIENKREFKVIPKNNPRSLLPNALTIFGVCLGLSSIKFAIDSNYTMAVIAIGFAAILDTLDGQVYYTPTPNLAKGIFVDMGILC